MARLTPRHIRMLRDERADQLGAANQRLKALKALFAWACEEEPEIAPQNPTVGCPQDQIREDGHHSWAAEEIAQYRDRHPLGSKARLALDLLLYTGGRREDAVRFGPQHVHDGRIRFTQAKNEHRNPIEVDIPLHPELATTIAATRSGHLTFLITTIWQAIYTGRVRQLPCATGATKPTCVTARHTAYGRRVAAALGGGRRDSARDRGGDWSQSLEEIERYTRAARKKKLADAAMAKLK